MSYELPEVNRHSIGTADRSKAPSVDPSAVARNADLLFKWAGSFWSEIYEDDGLVRDLQSSRATILAQRYLDVVEALRLVDRNNAPVFHRERWFPIRVRRSQRNKASAGILRTGSNEVVLGEQTSDIYPEGTVFRIGGGDASFKGMVVYPMDESVKLVAVCIVDNIVSPTMYLHSGTDFAVVNGSLVMREDDDPFAEGSPFAVFEDPYIDADREEDKSEAVLWACDAEIDRDYVMGHLGYAMGLPVSSSETFLKVVNAVWDTVSEGATPGALQALVAALCEIPSVVHDREVVQDVVGSVDDGWQVITDMEVYRLPAGAVPRDSVRRGSVLRRFDLLDKSVRVYPRVIDVDRIMGMDEFSDMMADIPAIDIPPAMIRAGVDDGFYVGWDERDVVCEGFFDEERTRPKLSFRLEGSEPDNDVFWRDVWSSYERAGASMDGIFGDGVHGPYVVGEKCGSISPIRFFLRQIIGANTLIVTVRTDALPDDAPLYDPNFFKAVRDCIPAHVRLYFIEHCRADTDGYGVSNEDGVLEDAEEFVYDDEYEDARLDAKSGFRCRDKLVSARFVARCRDGDGPGSVAKGKRWR